MDLGLAGFRLDLHARGWLCADWPLLIWLWVPDDAGACSGQKNSTILCNNSTFYGSIGSMAKTLYDKLWEKPRRPSGSGWHGSSLYRPSSWYEVTSPQAFEGLAGWPQAVARFVHRLDAGPQHADRSLGRGIKDPISRQQVETLDANIREVGALALFSVQGSAHGAFCMSSVRKMARHCPA